MAIGQRRHFLSGVLPINGLPDNRKIGHHLSSNVQPLAATDRSPFSRRHAPFAAYTIPSRGDRKTGRFANQPCAAPLRPETLPNAAPVRNPVLGQVPVSPRLRPMPA